MVEISELETCASCYRSIDGHNGVGRALKCVSCGALAVECRLCQEIARNEGWAPVSDCAGCTLDQESSDDTEDEEEEALD